MSNNLQFHWQKEDATCQIIYKLTGRKKDIMYLNFIYYTENCRLRDNKIKIQEFSSKKKIKGKPGA